MLFSWGRKPESQATLELGGPMGLELNASVARAVAIRPGGPPRILPLEPPHADLPLAVSLERRVPEVGRRALNHCRKTPHLACLDFLPLVGAPREWRNERKSFAANDLLAMTFDKLRPALGVPDALAVVVPHYLALPQVTALLQMLGERTKLAVKGSASTTLALASMLQEDNHLELSADSVDVFESDPSRPTALIVDADDHALTAAAVQYEESQVRLTCSTYLPRLGVRQWKERLLEALADRCIRLCRRDPRDSAITEQALYEQLDDALDRTRAGQRIDLQVRSSHWYQNLPAQADDFDGYCAHLVRQSLSGLREVIAAASVHEPPRVLWLTASAARLPGLVNALSQELAERTTVTVLPVEAPARAAAGLAARWQIGDLPRVHLDTLIPYPLRRDRRPRTEPVNPAKGLRIK